MEVDDAATYNTSSTKTVVVQTPAVAVATTKVQPPRSSAVFDVNKKRQKIHNKVKPTTTTATSKIKTTPIVVPEDYLEDNNSIRLVVSSDEDLEDKNIQKVQQKQQQSEQKSLNNNNNSTKKTKTSPILKEELNSDEEKTVKFCAKRKRYEVSNLGSQEILLGCDEASGETCLISESAAEPEIIATLQQQIQQPQLSQQEQINNNNMAESKNSTRQNNKKITHIETKEDEVMHVKDKEELENSAPAAKRSKKNSPAHATVDMATKASPSRKVAEASAPVKQQQTHIVADLNERSVPETTTKTRSTTNGQKQAMVATVAAAETTPSNKPLTAQDDFYKKPFEYGWKRELVWRATPESGRERADVYFISPAGKKIRTRHDITPLLQGDLKMEHFCWLREPVGVGPEHETVRNAKPNPNRSTAYAAVALAASAAVNTPVSGKRMPKPKGPKGASPPPEGWTPTRALKVNNAALNSRSGGMGGSMPQYHRSASATSTRSTGGVSNKKKKTATATTKCTTTATTTTTTNNALNVSNNHNNNTNAKNIVGIMGISGTGDGGGNNNLNNNNNNNSNINIENTTKSTTLAKRTTNATTTVARKIITSDDDLNYQNILNRNICEPCTIMCPRAPGLIPQLQCVKCLCLYHHQCVGLSPNSSIYRRAGDGHNGRDYICESCSPKAKNEATMKNNQQSSTASTAVTTPTTKSTLTSKSKQATSAFKSQGQTGTKAAATTTVSRSTATPGNKRNATGAAGSGSGTAASNKFPQTIAVVKGKKYVVVEKPRTKTKHSEYANDIENDLKQINESIRNSLPTQPSLTKLEAAYQQQQQQQHNALATVSTANQFYGRNFFANMSYGFDSLLIILKYLKIHERMRFGSVCKLWYAAANSRSVWQTVRMKNSKVCDWAGCAAALQRNGTKHLDLRKMLFSSVRADEIWADFSAHIGKACFLENIDLCRCPARVVEALFKSNKNLRILNAMTINDDALNLEHINNLSNLVELRLRTNEAAVLTHNLAPLASLTKLTHFSLTAISSLGSRGIEALKHLKALRSLELGECGGFDETFAHVVLPQLTQLQRLRLENGQDTSCCTLAIMKSASKLKQLKQLELVNFDVRPSFEELLQQFKTLSKLLIIPTYLSQSATTNQTVLDAVQKIAPQLKVFTWGVTVELLRVTALYVDQCEESSKKEKHNFNECIPVLKPVPGAAAVDEHDMVDADNSGSGASLSTACDSDFTANDVPQIEILPLDKVERILAANMPNTKFQIVKVPYHATCKQQLVE